MTYPSRKRPLRNSEMYQAPPPEWAKLDLEQWLEKNVTDPEFREWYRRATGKDGETSGNNLFL